MSFDFTEKSNLTLNYPWPRHKTGIFQYIIDEEFLNIMGIQHSKSHLFKAW